MTFNIGLGIVTLKHVSSPRSELDWIHNRALRVATIRSALRKNTGINIRSAKVYIVLDNAFLARFHSGYAAKCDLGFGHP